MRFGFDLILGAHLILGSSEVERVGLEVSWEAPPSCPSSQAFVRTLEARLGTSLASLRDIPLRVHASVESSGSTGWRLVLRTWERGTEGERVLEDRSCALLAEAATLVVALSIDTLAVVRHEKQVRTGPPAAPNPIKPAPTTVARASSRSRPGAAGLLRVSGLIETGMLPAVGAGIEFAAGAWLGLGSVDALGRYWFERDKRSGQASQAGVRLQAWTAGLRGCVRPAAGRAVEFPLCAGMEAGQIIGDGFGVRRPRTGFTAWAAVQLSVGVAWVPVRWFALAGTVEGAIALARPTFAVDNLGDLHRPAPGSLRGSVAVEVRFP